jgi:hypothetical protein
VSGSIDLDDFHVVDQESLSFDRVHDALQIVLAIARLCRSPRLYCNANPALAAQARIVLPRGAQINP